MKEAKKEDVIEVLEGLNDYKLLDIWRQYCDEAGYYGEEIFDIDEFNEICSSMDAWDVAQKTFYGDFCPAHSYWKFNGYENFESSDYISDLICLEDLADYIVENEETFNNYELENYFIDLGDDE